MLHSVRASLQEPELNTDPGQPESQEGLPCKGGGEGGLTRLDYCFHVNTYKHLTAKGLLASVILPGLKRNPGSCKEALRLTTLQKCQVQVVAYVSLDHIGFSVCLVSIWQLQRLLDVLSV